VFCFGILGVAWVVQLVKQLVEGGRRGTGEDGGGGGSSGKRGLVRD
jgi:hypothetical protein